MAIITVIGSGMMGSAMAFPACRNGHTVRLVGSPLDDRIIEHGKKTEIDFINGIVVEYGKKYGVATPYNQRVVEIVHGIEDGKFRPSFDNVKLFWYR